MGAALSSLDYVHFDQTLADARSDIGPNADFHEAGTVGRLRCWLNAWGCRLRYPREGEAMDPFVSGVSTWWVDWKDRLPALTRALDLLGDPDLLVLAGAFETLRQLPISLPGDARQRSIGPTAASKLLYFLRPEAALPWDAKIARHFGTGRGHDGYLAHLDRSRNWARALVAEAKKEGIHRRQIGLAVGRPNSSVAKLVDEYLYQAITRNQTFWALRI